MNDSRNARVARIWNGRTASVKASDAYQAVFLGEVLPVLRETPGFGFAHLLRADHDDGGRFKTVTFFESMDAIRGFAGDDPTRAHVGAPARAVLSIFDERVSHYTVVDLPAGDR